MAESSANKDQNAAAGEHLVAFLRSIENRCLTHAVGLPKQKITEKPWEGVLFSIAGRLYATHINEVSEILNHPSAVTKVPGTNAWITGIANIRGNLLPIVDLQAFLLKRQTMRGRRSRILVINHDGLYSGLLVDPFVGIRRFYQSEQTNQSLGLHEAIDRYVDAVYEQVDHKDNKTTLWPIFSMHRLISSQEFRSAAI